jgi:hypothetical protein
MRRRERLSLELRRCATRSIKVPAKICKKKTRRLVFIADLQCSGLSTSLPEIRVSGTKDSALGRQSKSHVAPVFQMSQPADVGGWRHNCCANPPRSQHRAAAEARSQRACDPHERACEGQKNQRSRLPRGRANQQSHVCLERAGAVAPWAAIARVAVRMHCFFRRQMRIVLLIRSWLSAACRTARLAGAAAGGWPCHKLRVACNAVQTNNCKQPPYCMSRPPVATAHVQPRSRRGLRVRFDQSRARFRPGVRCAAHGTRFAWSCAIQLCAGYFRERHRG